MQSIFEGNGSISSLLLDQVCMHKVESPISFLVVLKLEIFDLFNSAG